MARRTLFIVAVLILLMAACGPAATPPPPTIAEARAPTATTVPATKAPAAATATPARGTAIPATQPPSTPKPTPTIARAPAGPKSGGTLRTVIDQREPRSWDGWFIKSGSREVRTRHNLVFSQLFTTPVTPETDCGMVVTPELVKSWQWLQDNLLEIKIHEGVKFHNKPPVNGRELTAQDVAWSANQFIIENTAKGLEPLAPVVTKIEATGPYTVQFRTDGPQPLLVTEGLTAPYGSLVLPREALDEKGLWGDPAKSYIGSGPFMFDKHVPGVSTNFVKHPDYFKKGLPYLDTVRMMIMPDSSTRIATLRSGALDLLFAPIPAAAALPLQGVAGIVVQSCPPDSTFAGRIQFRADQPPFDDVRVRRALQLAIDRDGLLKSVLLGQGITSPHTPREVLNHKPGWDELPPEVAQWVKYDPQRARQLLAEYKAANPGKLPAEIPMMLSTGRGSPYNELAEALTGLLQAAGFNVKPHWVPELEWAYFIASGNFGKDQLAFGPINVTSPLDGLAYWWSKSYEATNRTRIRDPEVDRLVDMFMRETDLKKGELAYKQLVTRVIDQAWEPTLGVFPLEFYGSRDYVKNFRGGSRYFTNTYLEILWLDR
ncbi:MAG: ABC transporter substrate-binding protein [Chloroflexi bacterium]|nr:ABC transporter substrate-binding protein [Chloroflexota bacterium]